MAARRVVQRADTALARVDRSLDARVGTPLGSRPEWVRVRAMTMLAAAVAAMALARFEHDTTIAAALVAGSVAQLSLPRLLPAGWMSSAQGVLDLFLIGVVMAVEPGLPAVALLWVGCVVAYQALTGSLRASMAVNAVAVTIVAGCGYLGGFEQWLAAAIATALLSLAFAAIGHTLRGDIAETEAELLSTICAAGGIVHRSDVAERSTLSVQGDIEAVTGYGIEEWTTTDRRHLMHPDDAATFLLDDANAEPDTIVDRVGRFRRADGGWTWLRDISRVSVDRDGKLLLRGFTFDVTDVEESAHRVRQQARLDVVTGLPNRLALFEHLQEILAADEPFALLLIDLDRFKEINDTLGHEVGDRALQVIAERLRTSLGPDHHISRLGGDEYAIVLGGVEGTATVEANLAEITTRCSAPITVHGVRFAVALSIGVAFRDAADDRATLLRHADIAMYDAKRSGTTHRFYDASLERTSTMQLSLSASLPEAIRNGEIVLVYQPKYDLRDGTLIGAEGLVRWDHPQFGRLTPGDFLELAVMSESTVDFTLATVAQAVKMIRRLLNLGYRIPIAANVSIRSLGDVNFARSILWLLQHHEVPPHLLTIEITENDVQHPSDEMRKRLVELRAAGVGLSIDDFGTGHSSLQRLSTLAVDELKIDRSFVATCVERPQDHHIVQAIIDIARRFGYRIIAEGVERQDQADLLAEMGCNAAQGFLFDRGLDADEFVDRVLTLAEPAGIDGRRARDPLGLHDDSATLGAAAAGGS